MTNKPQLKKNSYLAIGLMSGTSMDGIDATIISTDGESFVKEHGAGSISYDREFKALLKGAESAVVGSDGIVGRARGIFEEKVKESLQLREGVLERELDTAFAKLSKHLLKNDSSRASFDDVVKMSTDLHASLVNTLLSQSGYDKAEIDVVGFHGQTLFHRPKNGITIQIGDGQRLANAVGIPVVFDFRSNDIRHGGQGAPFAPLFHSAIAKQSKLTPVVIANCGGIANISVITGNDEELFAFDTGPGNTLIDRFVQMRVGVPYDKDGGFGRQGKIEPEALKALELKAMVMPDGMNYLELLPPKSLDVNDVKLIPELESLTLENGCATLEAFTAECIVSSLCYIEKRGIAVPKKWIVAGGGWKNPVIFSNLERRLREKLGKGIDLLHAEEVGWNGTALEAQIFAYLAVRSLKGLPLSVPGTTGVQRAVTGGKLVFPS